MDIRSFLKKKKQQNKQKNKQEKNVAGDGSIQRKLHQMGVLKTREEQREQIRQRLQRFKMDMMKQYPFYGDIMMHIPLREDSTIRTAMTNGREIRYNPDFFAGLEPGQCNYVLLHEVMHILLLHWKRIGSRQPLLWNIACDFMVNGILDRMRWEMQHKGIAFARPPAGCFMDRYNYPSAEEAYAQLRQENNNVEQITYYGKHVKHRPADLADARDSKSGALQETDAEETEKQLRELVRETIERRGEKGTGSLGGIPAEILKLGIVKTKRLPWDKLLYEFLQEREDEESSYLTPERKYIHMDLIVPGCGHTEDELGEIWAFIDTSGSIADNELEQFLTQLCHIAMQFHCRFHIGFWDTEVSEVYRNVRGTRQILECIPHSSGGTDINCVYRYLDENKLKPEVMLILTDGYFGELRKKSPRLAKRTILVITENGAEFERNNNIGRLARL